MINVNEFEKFLKGNETRTKIGDYNLVKVDYDKNFDFIYYLSYRDNLTFKDNLECAGFYNKVDKVFYPVTYPFNYTKADYIGSYREIIDEIKARIVKMFNQYSMTITPEMARKSGTQIDDYFVQYGAKEEARKAVLDGYSSTTYQTSKAFGIDKENVKTTNQDILLATLNPVELEYQLFERLQEEYADRLNHFALNKELVITHIKEMEQDKNLLKRQAIRKCLNEDMKTVNVTVRHDNKELTFKYPTNRLSYGVGENWMSIYDIPAKEREMFKELYGESYDFNASDIIRITFGKKVLFEE